MLYLQAQKCKKSLLVKLITNASLTGITLLFTVVSCNPASSEQNHLTDNAPEQATPSLKKENLQNVEQLINQAATAEANNKYDESEQIWRRIIQLQPNAIWAINSLASVLRIQDKNDEAIALYRQILQRYPREAKAYYDLGRTFIARNNFKKPPALTAENDLRQAIQAYYQGVELQPDLIESVDWVSTLSPEQVVSVVRQELQSKSKQTVSDYLLLWSALRSSRQSLESAGFARRNFPAACQQYPDACRDRGKSEPEQEIDALQQVIKLDPKLAIPYEMLGVVHYSHREYAEAVVSFEQATKLNPQRARAYYRLGDVLIAQNKMSAAVEVFYQAVQAEPHRTGFDFQFWFPSLWVSTQQPRDKIVAALIDELNKRPSSVGYYILGNLFTGLHYSNQLYPNQLDSAVTALQNAVKLDPTFAKAYERLGSVLARQKKSQEAEKAFRQAIQLDPKLRGAYRSLRDILQTQGKFDEAYRIFLAEQSMPE